MDARHVCGFAVVFSELFAKTYLIEKLFGVRRVLVITDSDLMPRIELPGVTLMSLYVGVWLYIAPLVLTEFMSDAHSKYAACSGGTPNGSYLGALAGLEGAFLLVGAYLSHKVKGLPSDYNGVYDLRGTRMCTGPS